MEINRGRYNIFRRHLSRNIDYVFPYGETSVKALNVAIALNPGDANAHYFLGNAYADSQPEKSIAEWQKAISLNGKTAIFYRNLAYAQANYTDNISGAVENIMKAISLNAKEARYFSEADNYMSYARTSPEKIASFLEENAASNSNDVKTIGIRLKNFMGDYDASISMLNDLNFRTEEGAAFNVHVYWFDAHLLRGLKKMNARSYNEAEKDFLRAMEFPANLESERDAKTGVALYFLAVNSKLKGNPAQAKEYFIKMVDYTYERGWGAGSFPEINFYKGLACMQLGKDAEAEKYFTLLIGNGNEGLKSRASGQYSRSSGDHAGRATPSLARRKADNEAKANAIYSKALGYLGQGDRKKADEMFKETLSINPTHLGAKVHVSGEWKMALANKR